MGMLPVLWGGAARREAAYPPPFCVLGAPGVRVDNTVTRLYRARVFENLLARGEHLARVEANRAVLRFLNGVEWLIRDPKTVIGRTPYDVVLKRDKLEV